MSSSSSEDGQSPGSPPQQIGEAGQEGCLKRARSYEGSGKWDKAINEYTEALKLCSCTEREALTLCSRSRAFARLSMELRHIPAARSERAAIYGMDPYHLAQLALKDGVRAATLDPKSAIAFGCQGQAHFLLEGYSEAENAYLEGLRLQPDMPPLMHGLRAVREALRDNSSSDGAAAQATPEQPAPKRQRRVQRVDDFECILCMKLFLHPITTPCGHTFCRDCFLRATDHSSKCPMCRTVLHIGREPAVSITLQTIIEKCFPDEYAQRKAEMQPDAAGAPELPLPLFVMSVVLPGERMALNIFEPRYRLMVRRCMEGNRRFGMATVSQDHELSSVGCECEITDCQPMPDGRFYLEITGKRRFRIVHAFEQDGYRLAQPDYFSDTVPEPDSPAAAATRQACKDVEELADQWVERVWGVARAGRSIRVQELLNRGGPRPAPGKAEEVSFWVANIIPLGSHERLQLMEMTTTLDRLNHEKALLSQLDASVGGQGCSIM